jgi:putative ABC transport system ATP-binding protein
VRRHGRTDPGASAALKSAGSDDAVVLELDGLRKSYQQGTREVVVLDEVSLQVEAGEFVSLVGPSGSGKSTLLHIAGGIDRPDQGRVRVNGMDLSDLGAGDLARMRRRHIGFVFQFFQLLPTLTVRENVELPVTFDGKWETNALDLLDRIGLGQMADRFPGELSGGEMQRVAIARAMIAGAPLILADEPTGNLDASNAAEVLHLLTEQVRQAGSALLLVTHDATAARKADRVLTLEDGHLAEQ